ncbi:MAG: hypothetical protein WC998_02060 [Candidatus Paceibacterota bacterium]|jgi:hypothetical protein
MYIISRDLLYYVRALLFGIAVGYTVMAFFFYFKAFAENTIGRKIDTDIWWWSGVTISVLLGILASALLM